LDFLNHNIPVIIPKEIVEFSCICKDEACNNKQQYLYNKNVIIYISNFECLIFTKFLFLSYMNLRGVHNPGDKKLEISDGAWPQNLGGGGIEEQTHILGGGKIEFLKRYCHLPMPLSQEFRPPQEIRPPALIWNIYL
jgi:hypothetical protein